MQISGKVIQVLNLEQGVGKASGKEWRKQTFVLSVYYSDNERRQVCRSRSGATSATTHPRWASR